MSIHFLTLILLLSVPHKGLGSSCRTDTKVSPNKELEQILGLSQDMTTHLSCLSLPAEIPRGAQKEYQKLAQSRKSFFDRMLSLGGAVDDNKVPLSERKKVLDLAQQKARDEINLFIKMNKLEDVLSENSPVRIRVVKFPELPDKISSMQNPTAKQLMAQPKAGSSHWASFHAQNKGIEAPEMELYLEDRNGRLHKFKSYNVAGVVGSPGPKLREGDFQLPEGEFPLEPPSVSSNRFMAVGIDVNPKSIPGRGSNIKIHGNGATEGCVVLSNAAVAEVAGYLSRPEKPSRKGSGHGSSHENSRNGGSGGGSSGRGNNILITPFRMEKGDAEKYANQMSPEAMVFWDQEISKHPDLKQHKNLKNFWNSLADANKAFLPCETRDQTNCVSPNAYELPNEVQCLQSTVLGAKDYISPSYYALANRSNHINYHTPLAQETSLPPRTPNTAPCEAGKVQQWRVEYTTDASVGTTIMSAKDQADADRRASEKYPRAHRLKVTSFCMNQR